MILGTDISHWEDNPNTPQEINFEVMKSAGAQFCIFKATQAKWTDRVFQISWADCRGVLPRGAYCYLDWSIPAIEQAIYFCNAIKNDPPELPPIVDFECRKNNPAGTTGQLWNWLTYVEEHTGKVPMIYTAPYYWYEFGSTNIAWKKYPLWIANYGVVKPLIPLPWTDYTFWQYTDKGDGKKYGCEALGVDLNWFNGGKEQLDALCGITTPPTVPPTLQQKVEALYEQGKLHGWTLP
jgi:lysozyme